MSRLLEQLGDDELEPTVSFSVEGKKKTFDFLDIVSLDGGQFVVVAEKGSDAVEIFRILAAGTELEQYVPADDETAERVFELFMIKNEDEFDFE